MPGSHAQEVVRVPAELRGMGAVAGCVLETWQERSSAGRSITRCRIVDDPSDLPDGVYDVNFAGTRLTTWKRCGIWELTFLASPDLPGNEAA